jgi:hypothetical protein
MAAASSSGFERVTSAIAVLPATWASRTEGPAAGYVRGLHREATAPGANCRRNGVGCTFSRMPIDGEVPHRGQAVVNHRPHFDATTPLAASTGSGARVSPVTGASAASEAAKWP